MGKGRWRDVTSADLRVGMVIHNSGGRRWHIDAISESRIGPRPVIHIVELLPPLTGSVQIWDCNLKSDRFVCEEEIH